MRILQELKNALIKQYQKMFELENVELKFTTNALKAVAAGAIKLETGARGLRSSWNPSCSTSCIRFRP